MIVFRFNNAEINAPDSWEEVSVEYFIKPEFLAKDSISLFTALTGINRDELLNSTDDSILDSLYRMVKFYTDDPTGYRGKIRPITVKGKKVRIPKNIELERLGQKIMFQEAMFKNKFVYQSIPEAVAIYLVPEVNDGKFDDALVPEVADEIRKMRIQDVWPVADFFLASFRSLVKSGKTS